MKNDINVKPILALIAFSILAQCVSAQVSIPTLKLSEKYSVVSVLPDMQGLTTAQKAVLAELKKDTQSVLPELTSTLGGALMQERGINQIFVQLGNKLSDIYKSRLGSVRNSLPNDPIFYTLYILPWETQPSNNPIFQLAMLGNAQQINFDLGNLPNFKLGGIDKKMKSADLFAKVDSQIRGLRLTAADKFQLQSIAVHLKIAKNESEVKIQVLGRLKQSKMPFAKSNPQVDLNQIEIFGDEAKGIRPMTLINITQALQPQKNAVALPRILVQLGEYGGISGSLLGWPGLYQINVNPWKGSDCHSRLNSVPALTGKLGPKALGNSFFQNIMNKIVKGQAVKFRILNINIDAETLKIAKMELALEVGAYKFPQCISNAGVNEQFKGEANAAIEEQLSSLYKQDDMTDNLMAALYN